MAARQCTPLRNTPTLTRNGHSEAESGCSEAESSRSEAESGERPQSPPKQQVLSRDLCLKYILR